MAYDSIDALPEETKELPTEAKMIYKTAFNAASDNGMDTESATQVAWNSVKNQYEKTEDGWKIPTADHGKPGIGSMPAA